jgi:hypothetical protein
VAAERCVTVEQVSTGQQTAARVVDKRQHRRPLAFGVLVRKDHGLQLLRPADPMRHATVASRES